MADWNMFDSLGELFGDHYGVYKDCMQNIEDLKELKKKFLHDFYYSNTEVGRELNEIIQSYQNLADNLDTRNYSWNGADMRTCWQRVLERRDALRQLRTLKTEACRSVEAAIDEDCRKWGDAAMRELNSFNIFDKITCTVDVTLQAAKDRLERMIRSL